MHPTFSSDVQVNAL